MLVNHILKLQKTLIEIFSLNLGKNSKSTLRVDEIIETSFLINQKVDTSISTVVELSLIV